MTTDADYVKMKTEIQKVIEVSVSQQYCGFWPALQKCLHIEESDRQAENSTGKSGLFHPQENTHLNSKLEEIEQARWRHLRSAVPALHHVTDHRNARRHESCV